MMEPFTLRIKRRFHEWQERVLRWSIRKLVRWYDVLNSEAFMALSLAYDEHIDYHIIAERSYDDHHIYGTKVDFYERVGKQDE